MEIKDYQNYVNEGISSRYTLELALLGLVGEVGEVCDVVKKHGIYPERFETATQLQDKIIDELGDVMWQAFAVATVMGIPMDHILEYNINKLNERHGGVKIDETGGKR